MAVLAGTFLEILLFGLLTLQTWRRKVETSVQKADEEFKCPREWSAQGARSHHEPRNQVLGGVEIVSLLAIFLGVVSNHYHRIIGRCSSIDWY